MGAAALLRGRPTKRNMSLRHSDITIEAKVRKFIEGETDSSPNQIFAHFNSWRDQRLNPITIEETSVVAGARRIIDEVKQYHLFETKLCYENALQMATSSRRGLKVNYVEGLVVINERMIFSHAWNSIKGKYFDYTTELANEILDQRGISIIKRDFFKLIELPPEEAIQFSLSCKVPIQILHFLEQNRLQLSHFEMLRSEIEDGSFLH